MSPLTKLLCAYLGNGEKTDPGDEDQGHGIEPASNVGENPQRQTKLDGIKHVLNKKETSKFEKGTVQFGRSVVGEAVHFFLGNLQVEFCKKGLKKFNSLVQSVLLSLHSSRTETKTIKAKSRIADCLGRVLAHLDVPTKGKLSSLGQFQKDQKNISNT